MRGNKLIGVRLARAGVVLAALSAAPAGVAFAQTNERAYESLEFRVVTPGARAVAMGKTFVGMADDATAAASNPAGLSNLLDPELSIEWSGVDIRHTRMVAVNPLKTLTFNQFVAFPTFASFVTPMPDVRALRNVTIAAFYNSLQRYREEFDIPELIGGERTTEGGYFGNMRIDADAAGVGGAILLANNISIGGSLTAQRLRIESDAYSGLKPTIRNGTETDDRDVRLGGQLGVLVKPAPWLSVGGAYYSGTTFELTTTIVGVFSPENSPPLPPVPIADIKTDRIQSPVQRVDYRIPDRFTIGAALHPAPSLTLVADAAVVKYSQRITKHFLIVDFLAQPSAGLEPAQYVIDDAVEFHAGAEYRRPGGGRVVALRAGVFTDPDHQMHFDYEGSTRSPQAGGQSLRFNSYNPGTVVGVSAGGGLVLGNVFQIDGAVSLSQNAREIVLSSVVRFRR